MYRVLVLVVAVPLVALADFGHAARKQFDVEILAIDLAGHQANLTQNPAWDSAPAVARDGRIVFLSSRDGTGDFYVMDGDGRNLRRLTMGKGVWSDALDISQASWSLRGEKIAFDSWYRRAPSDCPPVCSPWDVLVVDSDGSGLKQIAVGARAPAWSFDGHRLAFESDIDHYGGAGSVTITRLDGSGSVRLKAFNHFSDVGPVWSPTRSELAFQAGPDGSASSIYVVRGDGGRKRRLASGHNPAWSPDGQVLAFIDDYKLITIDRNGKRKRVISRKGEFVVGAAWSPRGDILGFVAGTTAGRYGGTPSNLRVETVSADGKRVHVLARESPDSLIWGPPVWTPDGKRILVAVEAH